VEKIKGCNVGGGRQRSANRKVARGASLKKPENAEGTDLGDKRGGEGRTAASDELRGQKHKSTSPVITNRTDQGPREGQPPRKWTQCATGGKITATNTSKEKGASKQTRKSPRSEPSKAKVTLPKKGKERGSTEEKEIPGGTRKKRCKRGTSDPGGSPERKTRKHKKIPQEHLKEGSELFYKKRGGG